MLDRLHQSGPLRARIIRPESGAATTAILLNTAGGIAGGDRHSIDIAAQPATSLTLTTQGAERVYRAGPADRPAWVVTNIVIAEAATVENLPQETILFDQSRLTRRLHLDLAGSSRYLGVDSLIFGRAAMGESIRQIDLADTIELHRDASLIFRDRLRPPMEFATAQNSAMFGTATALATILLAAPNAAFYLDAVRAALIDTEAGASAWNGLLLVRILAQTGSALRSIVLRVLAVLRGGQPMPRVWAC